MAPSRKDKADRATNRSQTKDKLIATSKVVQQYVLPIEIQQAILNIFTHALPIDNYDLKTTVQEVKGHLYNRDFTAAFSKAEYLHVYALRWSAARALAYSHVLNQPARREWFLPNNSNGRLDASAGFPAEPASNDAHLLPTKVACIGGGAGAEIVALAATSRAMNLSQPLEIYAIDIADWSEPAARLYAALTTPPPLSTYASSAVRASNRAFIDPGKISVRFCHRDVLDLCSSPSITAASREQQDRPKPTTEAITKTAPNLQLTESAVSDDTHPAPSTPKAASDQDQTLYSILSAVTICTMMFTLNELFSTSIAKTTAMLLSLTNAMRPQSRLVVVDSPGSYSEIKLGPRDKSSDGKEAKQPGPAAKKYPMKWLLDHTLLELAGQQKWRKVEGEDSVWFRIEDPGKTLRYPLELENCRYQIHVYQRL